MSDRKARIKELVDKLVSDAEFRERFMAAPATAAAALGLSLSEEEIKLLRSLPEGEALTEEIEERLSKSACMLGIVP